MATTTTTCSSVSNGTGTGTGTGNKSNDNSKVAKRKSLCVDNLQLLTPTIAWPTVLLAVGSLSLWGSIVAQRLISPSTTEQGTGIRHWLWLLLSTLSVYLCFTPCHDAAHGSIFRCRHVRHHNHNYHAIMAKTGNELIGQLCGIPLLAPFTAFRHVHLLHHKYTNHPDKDPDMHAQTGGIGYWLTIELSYYVYLVRHYRETPRRVLIISIGYQLALIAAMVWVSRHYEGGFYAVLWGILIPQRLAVGLLAYCFDYVPHHQTVQQQERGMGRYTTTKRVTRFFNSGGQTEKSSTTTTRTTLPSIAGIQQWLLSMLLLGQDAHIIHHLYPQLPFYKYHEIWNKHEQELYQLGVKQTSLF